MKLKINTEINNKSSIFAMLVTLAIIITLLLPGIILAQAPLPTKPAAEATGVNPSNVEFVWTASDPTSDNYTIDISKKSDMSSIAITKTVTGGLLAFTYNGTLEDNMAYYWRVSGGGQTSPVLKFTTKTATTTTTTAKQESFIDTIVNAVGWPLILGIFSVLFIAVVLILAFRKPKKKGDDQSQGQDPFRRPPPVQNQCPACGFLNPSNRQSCISCGGVLPLSMGAAGGIPMGPQGMRAPGQMGQPGTMGAMGTMPLQQQQMHQSNTCPTCGSPATPGKQFCGNCGTSLATVSPQFQQQQPPQFQQSPQFQQQQAPQFQQQGQQQQTQQNIICPSCGAPNPTGRQFCGNCGTSLAGSHQKQIVETRQSFACPICGATISPGMNPCPGCGNWLDWGP